MQLCISQISNISKTTDTARLGLSSLWVYTFRQEVSAYLSPKNILVHMSDTFKYDVFNVAMATTTAYTIKAKKQTKKKTVHTIWNICGKTDINKTYILHVFQMPVSERSSIT